VCVWSRKIQQYGSLGPIWIVVPQKKNIADIDIQENIFYKYAVLTSVVCLTLGRILVTPST
jgi:hypothetical protein